MCDGSILMRRDILILLILLGISLIVVEFMRQLELFGTLLILHVTNNSFEYTKLQKLD